jgi:succinate dehydrogenase/fumarate reductase-like Fe-S protein
MLKGYRGFLREMANTGGWRAFALELRVGAAHVARRFLRPATGDPIELFLRNYGADGFRLPDPERARLQLAAESCLVCGLCSMECARVGGAPRLDPRDAVISAARLEIDWIRLGFEEPVATPCTGCRACATVCPVGIPIDQVQQALADRIR